MARLIYTGEDGTEQTLFLGAGRPVVVVGRQQDCDLRTRNNTVSRVHARFLWEAGVVRVVDNRSANGVWVGKERVAEAELEDGEKVFLGAMQITVRLDPEDLEDREEATEEGPPPVPEVPVAATPGPRGTESWSRAPVEGGPSSPMETIGYADADVVLEPDEVVFREEGAPPVPAAPVAIGEAVREPERRPEEGPEESLRKRLAEQEAALEEGRQRLRQLESQVEDLTRVVEHQAAELQEAAVLRERLAGLERSSSLLEVDARRLREEMDEAVRRAEEAETDRERLRAERDVLEQDRAEAIRRAEEAELRRESLEAELADLRLRVQEMDRTREEGRELEQARDRIPGLEREIEALRQRAETAERLREEAAQRQGEDRQALAAVTEERDRLLEEVERWEVLKRQFDEDRATLQARLEAREREVADLSQALKQANGTLEDARRQGASAQAMASEIDELKAANRAALKKVARLMEELEKVQSAPRVADSGETEALRSQVADLQRRLQEVLAERDRLREFGEQLQQRLAALEAAPPAAPAPAEAAAPVPVPGELQAVIDRINGAISEFRTGLDVLTGLLPEVMERIPGGAGEDGEQLAAALEDLGRLSGELKAEVVQARRLVRE
ncbi:FHA domain-containing protein [Myxococcota bacterium]|nr:FHA domain-containing protein [Myxococcota bacterium]